MYANNPPTPEPLRLEAVTTSVNCDDLLDVSLAMNHPHLDTMIVVTSHEDRKTQMVCAKHGVICVQTDLFKKNGRHFNKGAAINAGLSRFQYHGWRAHLDCDIILPDNFRRMFFNHTYLDTQCIYGMDRVDVIGLDELNKLNSKLRNHPQAIYGYLIDPTHHRPISHRYVDNLRGYVPIGYAQIWFCTSQKDYPYSLGTCQHDDVLFGEQWSSQHRRLLPTVICYHLCARQPVIGENWEGFRQQPRLDETQKLK